MTSRERVVSALHRRAPDRVPFAWGFGPTAEMAESLRRGLAEQGIDWERLRDAAADIRSIGPDYTGPTLPPDTDIWGIRRHRTSYGAGAYDEIAFCPLAEAATPADIEAYPWPDPACYDYAGMGLRLDEVNPGRGLAIRSAVGNPFEIYCWMTGLETALVNVLANPDVVTAALDRIAGFFLERLRRLVAACGGGMDILFFADDLGTQQGLLMSREAYRGILQPFHRRLFEFAHSAAPHASVMFHSDGAVSEVLPDLLDAGIDCLEAVQTDAAGMDPAALKRRFGSRMAFHGAISVQGLLPHGRPESVLRECRRLVDVLGKGGGYVAAPAHAIQVGTPVENVLAMLRGVLGETEYERTLSRCSC